MAACEEPVSLLIGTEGAGLYNCITADLEVSPPLKLFFCREQLCRESQGDLSLVFFLLCLVILTWRFKKTKSSLFFRFQTRSEFKAQRSSTMPLLFRINCFSRNFSPAPPRLFCHPQ